jgi:hypothetical protein
MRTNGFIRHTMMVAALVVVGGLCAGATDAADQSSKAASLFASPESLGIVASGAVEDSLKACLARIPKVSSAGQRMMAEVGCGRDEDNRQAMRAVPGH